MFKQTFSQAFHTSDIQIIPLSLSHNPYKKIQFLSSSYAMAHSLKAIYIINLDKNIIFQLELEHNEVQIQQIKSNTFLMAGSSSYNQSISLYEVILCQEKSILKFIKVKEFVDCFYIEGSYIYMLSNHILSIYKYLNMKLVQNKVLQIEKDANRLIIKKNKAYFHGNLLLSIYDLYKGQILLNLIMKDSPIQIEDVFPNIYVFFQTTIILLKAHNFKFIQSQIISELIIQKILNQSGRNNLVMVGSNLNNQLILILFKDFDKPLSSAQISLTKIKQKETLLNAENKALAIQINENKIQIIDEKLNFIKILGSFE